MVSVMAKKAKFSSIFQKQKAAIKQDSIPSMKEVNDSRDIEVDEDGNIQLTFKSEKGTGKGVNRVPFQRLEEYIEVMEAFIANPPEEVVRDADIISVVENTAKLNDGVVSHSWEYGKGKKPLRILQSDLPAYVEMLKANHEVIVNYLENGTSPDEDEEEFEDDEFEDEDSEVDDEE